MGIHLGGGQTIQISVVTITGQHIVAPQPSVIAAPL